MKRHLLTCAMVLSLIVGTLLIVFTFENIVFALVHVQFMPTSAAYRGIVIERALTGRIDHGRAAEWRTVAPEKSNVP